MVETFAVGDVVQLKSGGASMTVERVDGDDMSCVWFEGKKVESEIRLGRAQKVCAAFGKI